MAEMVVEGPPFGGDQNPQNVDYFLKNVEKWWKKVLIFFNLIMILKLIKIKTFNFYINLKHFSYS